MKVTEIQELHEYIDTNYELAILVKMPNLDKEVFAYYCVLRCHRCSVPFPIGVRFRLLPIIL